MDKGFVACEARFSAIKRQGKGGSPKKGGTRWGAKEKKMEGERTSLETAHFIQRKKSKIKGGRRGGGCGVSN